MSKIPLRTRYWLTFAVILTIFVAGIAAAKVCNSPLYAELVRWQTGIGAVLGFGGLIVAALYHADLNRERDDRRRDKEIRAIARALSAEIKSISAFMRVRAKTIKSVLEKTDKKTSDTDYSSIKSFLTDLLMPPEPRVYTRIMEKVGYMPQDVADDVFEFYERLAFAGRRVAEATHPGRERLDRAQIEGILGWYEGVGNRSQPAVDALNRFLGD